MVNWFGRFIFIGVLGGADRQPGRQAGRITTQIVFDWNIPTGQQQHQPSIPRDSVVGKILGGIFFAPSHLKELQHWFITCLLTCLVAMSIMGQVTIIRNRWFPWKSERSLSMRLLGVPWKNSTIQGRLLIWTRIKSPEQIPRPDYS